LPILEACHNAFPFIIPSPKGRSLLLKALSSSINSICEQFDQRYPVVQYLLENGADPTPFNGESPLAYVLGCKLINTQLPLLLRAYGAKFDDHCALFRFVFIEQDFDSKYL
jgi:hypothetical protein